MSFDSIDWDEINEAINTCDTSVLEKLRGLDFVTTEPYDLTREKINRKLSVAPNPQSVHYLVDNAVLTNEHLVELLASMFSYSGSYEEFGGKKFLAADAIDIVFDHLLGVCPKKLVDWLEQESEDYDSGNMLFMVYRDKCQRTEHWVSKLLAIGCDPFHAIYIDGYYLTPFAQMVYHLHVNSVRCAAERDLDKARGIINYADRSEITSVDKQNLLMKVLYENRYARGLQIDKVKEIVKLLIKYGANLNHLDAAKRNISDYIADYKFYDVFGDIFHINDKVIKMLTCEDCETDDEKSDTSLITLPRRTFKPFLKKVYHTHMYKIINPSPFAMLMYQRRYDKSPADLERFYSDLERLVEIYGKPDLKENGYYMLQTISSTYNVDKGLECSYYYTTLIELIELFGFVAARNVLE